MPINNTEDGIRRKKSEKLKLKKLSRTSVALEECRILKIDFLMN